MFSLTQGKRTRRSKAMQSKRRGLTDLPCRQLSVEVMEQRILLSHRCPPHCDAPPPPAPVYNVTDLGPGSADSIFFGPFDLNDKAAVEEVGTTELDSAAGGDRQAWFWSAATGVINLNDALVGSVASEAFGINDSSGIVGLSFDGSQTVPAYWRVASGVVTEALVLPKPAGHTGNDTEADDINGAGAIVGTSEVVDGGAYEGVRWQLQFDAAGSVTGVTTTGTGDFLPFNINESGLMAGQRGGIAAVAQFDAAGNLQFYSLGVASSGHTSSGVNAVNNNGDIAGFSGSEFAGYMLVPNFADPDGDGNPWYADTNGDGANDLWQRLGDFRATGINDARQVVGRNLNNSGVLWKDGTLHSLDELTGVNTQDGWAINNNLSGSINTGQITGQFVTPRVCTGPGKKTCTGGEVHGYLATPKPAALLGATVGEGIGVTPLTQSEAEAITAHALAQWAEVLGLSELPDVQVAVADLPDNQLGTASGGVITLDVNAAGIGWYVDATPWESSEFSVSLSSASWLASEDSPARGRYDVLTVAAHEIGHLLGLDHDHGDGVMADVLAVGTRRTPAPSHAGEQLAAWDIVLLEEDEESPPLAFSPILDSLVDRLLALRLK